MHALDPLRSHQADPASPVNSKVATQLRAPKTQGTIRGGTEETAAIRHPVGAVYWAAVPVHAGKGLSSLSGLCPIRR